MKEIYIKEHSNICEISEKNRDKIWFDGNLCELNIQKFLFFHNSDFYLVNYHSCIDGGDKYNFYERLLDGLFESKKIDKYEIIRGYQIEDNLKEMRLRDTMIKKIVHEVNYLYCDMVGKLYGLVTQIKISEYLIIDNKKLYENYLKAEKHLKEQKQDWLLDQLKELYTMNIMPISKVEIVKSTDYLIKTFNRKIRKNESSKQ